MDTTNIQLMMETDMSEKSTRLAGQDCRSFVKELKLFHNSGFNTRHPKGSTLWSEKRGDTYVVYSYGNHWPLLINWNGIWFANKDKSPSRTTTRHTSQTNPYVPAVPLSSMEMCRMASYSKPEPEMLVKAAKLKLIPNHLIPEVTAIRVGAAA